MKKKLNKTLISYAVNAGLVVLLYVVMMVLIKAGVINRYYEGIVRLICINIIMAVSLNLVCGFMGQLALGLAGFMSVGAYAAALFTMHCGLPEAVAFPLGLLVGGIVAAIVGFLIGIPALRMRGDYLAIITLGFGEIIRVVANALPITGGAKGLSGIPASTNFSWAYWVMILSVFVIFAFIKSRHGRAVISIREDEIAAEAMGINLAKTKMQAFLTSSFFAGIGGALLAMFQASVQARSFTSAMTYEILLIVVIGGIGSVTGSIIGSFLYIAASEWWLRFLDDSQTYLGVNIPFMRGGFRMVVFSVVIMLVVLFYRQGIMGTKEFSWQGIINFFKRIFKKNK